MKPSAVTTISVLASICVLSPSPSLSQSASAARVSVRFDPSKKTGAVEVTNTSKLPITAYNLTITTRFSEGPVVTREMFEDYVSTLKLAGKVPSMRAQQIGSLRPGAIRYLDVHASSRGNPESTIGLDISVDAVVFEDGTVAGANQAALDRIFSYRQEKRDFLAAWLGVLDKYALDPAGPPDALEGLKIQALSLHKHIKHPAQGPTSQDNGSEVWEQALKRDIEAAQQRIRTGQVSDKDWLRQHISSMRQDFEYFDKHSRHAGGIR
jgi:hypothetical protein